jgi:hypothetical protein
MESDDGREFFDAGLQNFGKALLAISEFKGLLEVELQSLMGELPPGSTLQLALEPGFSTKRCAPELAVLLDRWYSGKTCW